LSFLIIGVLSVGITGWLDYENAKSSLEEAYFKKLTAIRETKKRQIETYFNQIRNQIITFSEDKMIINAMKQFKKAFYGIEKDDKDVRGKLPEYASRVRDYYQNEFLQKLKLSVINEGTIEQYWPEDDDGQYSHATYLQYHYIANNPNPSGLKDELEMVDDGSEYSLVHSRYHPIIRNYLKKFGFYDIFLVDEEEGHIVYSVSKKVDFATSLLSGPYKYANISRAFKEAVNATGKEFVKLLDYETYSPSYGKPASFISSPIFDGEKKIGVLLFQMPIDEINRVMTGDYNWKDEGLGKSGETYIVGSDYKMRSDSRFFIEEPNRYFTLLKQMGVDIEMNEMVEMIRSYSTSILFQQIQTEAVEEALKGNKDTKIINDYRGIPVLSSYTPMSIEGLSWVMVSEIDKDEAFASVYVLRNRIFLITVIISALVIVSGLVLSRNISKPIYLLTKSMKGAREGGIPQEVNVTQKDEVGILADAFNKMIHSLKQAQDELVRREKFATIGRFSSSIAHDIRHPMATIKNSAYFLNMTLKDTDEKTKKHLNLIGKEISNADSIIRNMMQMIKTKQTEKICTNANKFIKEYIEEFSFPEKVKVITEYEDRSPDILIDRIQFNQILTNLITNAIRAMNRKGELRISAKLVGDFNDINKDQRTNMKIMLR